jgi:hypothetical protein
MSAIAGGWYGLSGAHGIPLEWLDGSPFTDYTIPSAMLMVVIGGSSALAASAVLRGVPGAAEYAIAAGVIVLVWMAAQLAIIGYVSWLQPAVAAGGVLILVLARHLA